MPRTSISSVANMAPGLVNSSHAARRFRRAVVSSVTDGDITRRPNLRKRRDRKDLRAGAFRSGTSERRVVPLSEDPSGVRVALVPIAVETAGVAPLAALVAELPHVEPSRRLGAIVERLDDGVEQRELEELEPLDAPGDEGT